LGDVFGRITLRVARWLQRLSLDDACRLDKESRMRIAALWFSTGTILAAAPAFAQQAASVEDTTNARTEPATPHRDDGRMPERADERPTPMSSNDVALTYHVLARIGALRGVDSGDVHVRVVRGAVTLYGTVVSEAVRTRVLIAAHTTLGVRVIRDELSLREPSSARGGGPNDSEIAQAATKFDHDPGAVGIPLEFSVQRGVVRVRGTVATYRDALRILREVRAIEGVREVHSELRVNETHVVVVRP
jgi:osmotically-inducible protein OsmY